MYTTQGFPIHVRAWTLVHVNILLEKDTYVRTYVSVCQDESFVEDINMLLNTGEVPNLYPPDEKADIIEKMQVVARTQVSSPTCTYMYVHVHVRMYVYIRMHVRSMKERNDTFLEFPVPYAVELRTAEFASTSGIGAVCIRTYVCVYVYTYI